MKPANLTTQRIYNQLREDILSGVRKPDSRLGEVAISEKLNVSRGPVRAALSLLAEAGIVTLVPHSGAKVRVIDLEDARALYQVRAALEAEAAYLAAAAINPDAAHKLRALLQEHTQQVAVHPTGAYLQSDEDRDFHIVIAKLSYNPVILQFLTGELYPQISLLRVKHERIMGRGRFALAEHERIIDAIVAGDAEVASLLMRRHINNSWASLEDQLLVKSEK
ncbi:MAG: GntR family transcriptional regulator [Hyphomicrobiales bacterium]|nr:MAG: GntR family transcriptional regulator [Hyphomicrobiales bacterium]